MSATLLTAPAIEPLSINDAKKYLRVEHDDDDVIIASLISAAHGHIEALARCGLMTQTWRLTLDCWPPDGRIRPKLNPLRSLVAARVFNEGGAASDLDISGFVIDKPAGVIAAPPWSLPAPGRSVAGIELDIDIGFGTEARDVPPVLAQAIRMLVAHWYENRGLIAIGQSVAMMPPSVNAMIGAHRVLSL